MKVLIVLILTFLISMPAYAQGGYDIAELHAGEAQYRNYMEICRNQEDFYRNQASDVNARLDQYVESSGYQMSLLLDSLEELKSCNFKDITQYCGPNASEKLTNIALNYDRVKTTAESFRRKANKMSDIVRSVGELLGEDIWDRIMKGDKEISRNDFPKLSLVTPENIPILYLQKGTLTTVVFPSSVEFVKGYYKDYYDIEDNMLFLEAFEIVPDEGVSNAIVKLKNGNVYPLKIRLANDENKVDILLEIKAESL